MEASFETRSWKLTAAFAYVGMIISVLVATATMPLSVVALGETVFGNIAMHSVSCKRLQYWLVGVGVILLVVDTVTVIAAMTRQRRFRIFAIVLLSTCSFLPLGLLTWGLIEHDARKAYLSITWSEMAAETKYLIQKYYSCCGFESSTEWTSKLAAVDSTCYAAEADGILWPDGCRQRMTSSFLSAPVVTGADGSISTFGVDKNNVLLVAFLLSMVALIVIHFLTAITFLVALTCRDGNQTEEATSETPYENVHAINGFEANGAETSNIRLETISRQVENHGQSVDSWENEAPASSNVQTDDNGQWYKRLPDRIVRAYESALQWLGVQVGTHPKMTIMLSLLLTAAFAVGLLQRWEPPAGAQGYLADDNKVVLDYELYLDTYIVPEEDYYMIVVDESNVLSSENFNTTLQLDTGVKSLIVNTGKNFSEICASVASQCKQRSAFEFWRFNTTVLSSISTVDVLSEISKTPLTSPIFGDDVNISQILGGIEKDSSGNIKSAKAHLLHYIIESTDNDWEAKFVALGQQSHGGVKVYPGTGISAILDASENITEIVLLFAGFCLIFVYIFLMTGKFSMIEHRVYVAMMGVTTAGMATGAGAGLAASFSQKWNVVHLVVPFLIIGIGVDDMFVLLQGWDVVQNDSDLKKKSVPEKAGHVLKSAGVSITVTSVTDLIAFSVGATSDLEAFSSFSIYVALCTVLLFILSCTFFTACTVLDQKRRDDRYDACLACCYRHKASHKAGKCSEREICRTFFEDVLGIAVTKIPVVVIVVLLTLGKSSLMSWAFSKLEVSYDPYWYLPTTSYQIPFNDLFERYFSGGEKSAAFVINADFYADRAKLHALHTILNASPDVDNRYLSSWFEDYVTWMGAVKGVSNVSATDAFPDASAFYTTIQEFLSGVGVYYSDDLVFQSGVLVGSRFPFRHRTVADGSDNIGIIENIQAGMDSVGFSGTSFPLGRNYHGYEITRIVKVEVYRNLGITMLCVLLVVLPMIASVQMGFWVATCVVLTVVDIAGSLYFAGLAIEATTISCLLLSVGLAVDYSAHIGHKFLQLCGTRKLRVRVTLCQMGPAVFNGAFSTFLALVMLSGSETYSFRVFFTVFACVVGYGLWNSLVFLPCILGVIGPAPHATAVEARLSERHTTRKKTEENGKTDKADKRIVLEEGFYSLNRSSV